MRSRRALVLPAGVPEDRVKAIMAAVDSFAGGEDFKAKLKKINEVQDYMSGDDGVSSLNAKLDAINAVVEANPEVFSK